jgi:amidohydrolase
MLLNMVKGGRTINKDEYIYAAKSTYSDMVAWRRHIHSEPERGLHLPKTTELVKKALLDMELRPQNVGDGIVATIYGQQKGKCVLLRADMDALPMPEKSGLPFASKIPGVNHACGHDMHTAMLLGAARILTEHKKDLRGCVKLMFQPDEEEGNGARQMLQAGVLEEPNVDVVIGIHTLVATDVPTSSIAVSPGKTLASSDLFRIDVKGKGCHGARPEEGVDPINILCHIHSMLQTLISLERPQKEPAVLTIGQISAGSAPNAIPDEGFMTGTLRTFDNDIRARLKRRIVEIAEGTAKSLGGSASVCYTAEMPSMSNDETVTKEVKGYLCELIGSQNVVPMPARMASEDFAEVMLKRPGVFLRLSVGSTDEGYTCKAHNPKVLFNEEAMPTGAAAYAWCASRWLAEHI